MNPPTRHLLWLSLLLLLPAASLPASDFDNEQRWSDQIVDSILDGEPVWLMADGSSISGNLRFQQQEIEGANHFFDDKNDELVDAVDDWLKTLP